MITNPGVKYDADISCIINIELKKGKRYGVNGMIKAPIFKPNMIIANPSASIDCGYKNFRLYAADRINFQKFNGTEKLLTEFDESYENPYRFEKEANGTNGWNNNYLNYGFDWFINDKSSLNFLSEWRSSNSSTKNYKSTNQRFKENLLTSYFEILKDDSSYNNNYLYSLFYKRKFDNEGNEISAEIYYNKQAGEERNEYTESFFNVNDLSVSQTWF